MKTPENICDLIMATALEMHFIPRGLPPTTTIADHMDSLDFAELCIELEDVLGFYVEPDFDELMSFDALARRIHKEMSNAKN